MKFPGLGFAKSEPKYFCQQKPTASAKQAAHFPLLPPPVPLVPALVVPVALEQPVVPQVASSVIGFLGTWTHFPHVFLGRNDLNMMIQAMGWNRLGEF